MLIVMNVVHVSDGRNDEFEEAFRNRESHLSEVPGFLGFELLRRDKDEEYAVVTRWQDEAAFKGWVGSESFRKSHQDRDSSLTHDAEIRTYEVVLSEEAAGAAAG